MSMPVTWLGVAVTVAVASACTLPVLLLLKVEGGREAAIGVDVPLVERERLRGVGTGVDT